MKITKIKLTNFRQFKNETTISLAGSGKEHISLIYGVNNAGKTTILAALMWALHGGSLQYVSEADQVCNQTTFHELEDGETIDVEVEVQLDISGKQYSILRTQKITKDGQKQILGPVQVRLQIEGVDQRPAQLHINEVIPPNLAKFFFFPGEKLEGFFKPERLSRLVEDIKTITEISTLEKAEKIFAALHRREATRTQNIPNATDLSNLVEAIQIHVEAKDNLANDLSLKQGEFAQVQLEIKECKKILGSNSELIPKLAQRASLSDDLRTIEENKLNVFAEMMNLKSEIGFVTLLGQISAKLTPLLGDMSSGTNSISWEVESFLRELLNNEVCVCGSELHQKGEKYHSLETFLNSRILSEGNSLIARVKQSLNNTLSPEVAASKIRTLSEKINLLERGSEELRGKLAENIANNVSIDDKYFVSKAEDLVRLELSSQKCSDEIEMLNVKIQDLESVIEEKNKELNRLQETSNAGDSVIRIWRVLGDVKEKLHSRIENHTKDLISELEATIQPMIQSFANRDIKVHVEENFEITVTDSVTGAIVGEGGGEEKTRAIAMVIALNQIARSRVQDISGDRDGSYPLVIDSAFGELSSDKRKKAVELLRSNNTQTILLVSDTQANAVTEEIDRDEVSASYLLQTYSKTAGPNVEAIINGVALEWLISNSNELRTEAVRI